MGEVRALAFSLFFDPSKGMYTTETTTAIDFKRLIQIYQSDKVKDITNQIRKADEQTKKELKKQLPFITPYGTFKPTRKLVNMTSFNGCLLCLDIDGLKPEQVQYVKFILTSNHSTLLCAVSPRGLGIKAMILISSRINKEYAYKQLVLNKSHIAETLGLKEFEKKIDKAQFVPTQPWFIAHDEKLYYNENCTALKIDLITYKEPTYFDIPVDFELLDEAKKSPYRTPIDYRIQRYFENATESLIKFFAVCSEGNRHSNIIKVQKIASWIHYAPELENEIKNKLLNACCRMYGNEREANANNVHKSFEQAWSRAQATQNPTIEAIIKDPRYTLIR